MGKYNPKKYAVDLAKHPQLVTSEIPGPKSKEYHARCTKYFKGLSEQVKLFPVAFESGLAASSPMWTAIVISIFRPAST